MVDHTVKTAIPIFQVASPGRTAGPALDKAKKYAGHATDTLRVEKLSKGPGRSQPCMREGFINRNGLPQTMQFPANYYNFALAGKPKGVKQILVDSGCVD